MKWKDASLWMWLLLFLCFAAGCLGLGMGEENQKKDVTEEIGESEDSFKIVTSFYPLYTMVINLAEGAKGVEIDNMAEPQTGCLHDYQLRPGDILCLEDADVFLANGGGMEEFLEDVFAARPDLEMLYALDGVDEAMLLQNGGHDHETEHAHEEEHDHEEGYAHEEEHFHEEAFNPHTWLHPILYKEEIRYLALELGRKNPENKEVYDRNRMRYEEKIDALMSEYEEIKKKSNKKGCVLLHESFAYLADYCGFPVTASMDVEKDSGFSAREIRDLIEEVEERGGGILISDSQYTGRISGLLSAETGMEVHQLDACVSGEYDKDAWLNSMRKNLEELKNAAD